MRVTVTFQLILHFLKGNTQINKNLKFINIHHYGLPACKFSCAELLKWLVQELHIVADFAHHEHILHKHVQTHTVSAGVAAQQQTEASRLSSFRALNEADATRCLLSAEKSKVRFNSRRLLEVDAQRKSHLLL